MPQSRTEFSLRLLIKLIINVEELKKKKGDCAGDVAMTVVIKAYSHHEVLIVMQRKRAGREN
jgi:hypothetical protein